MPTAASPWLRFVAGFIDAVLLFGAILAFAVLVPRQISENSVVVGLVLFVAFMYPVFMALTPWQATLGMKLFRFKLVDYQGGRPSLPKLLLRMLIFYPSMFLSGGALWGIYTLIVDYTDKRIFFHDGISKTVVVRS